ncbi:MAG TPA: hypothetical protein VJM50_18190 [Pyrinomonadaceae bacterium]|nr:hypothetical protein [Pyrinomonadaceae bacterium]
MAYDPFSDKAAENFLEGSATAAKWPKVGHIVEGTVTSFVMAQQTDYDTSEPLFWEGKKRVVDSKAEDKSRPVMQLLLEIQGEPTGETWEGLQNTRVELPDDDGMRTLYVKGGLQASLKQALKTAQARLEVGAYVKVRRIEDGPKSNPKFAAPHRYASEWTPASKNPKAVSSFMEEAQDENPWA